MAMHHAGCAISESLGDVCTCGVDPRAIHPSIKVVADNLPALAAISRACATAGWFAENAITDGLTHLLAELVLSDTPPDSPEHAAAKVALEFDI